MQDWETAVAVATGELNAQEAFIGGRIRLTGDQQKLLDSQPVFRALDGVFQCACGPGPTTGRADGAPMPELPEVQAHAERLTAAYSGSPPRPLPADHLHGAEDRRARAGRGLRPPARSEVGRRGEVPAAWSSSR